MRIPSVSISPEVLGGQPCFDGTRVPVDVLFVNLAAGERLDVILNSFPDLTREAAVTVLREACRLIRERALENARLSPEARAEVGPLRHPQDWLGLEVDESQVHYRRSP